MIVEGSGFIAKSLKRESSLGNYVFYARGVSNAKELHADEFKRDETMLVEALSKYNDRNFVYFSTCSIYDQSLEKISEYISHKTKMEELVLMRSNSQIIRLPNLIGPGQNSHNLLGYYIDRLQSGTPVEIWTKTYRNFLYIGDLYRLLRMTLTNNAQEDPPIISLARRDNTPVVDVYKKLKDLLGLSTKECYREFESNYHIPADFFWSKLSQSDPIFDKNYVNESLEKLVREI